MDFNTDNWVLLSRRSGPSGFCSRKLSKFADVDWVHKANEIMTSS